MKNTTEKKINWKKVAALGGMFAVGVVVGVVGGNAAVNKLIESSNASLSFTYSPTLDKKRMVISMGNSLIGRELRTSLDKGFAQDMLDVFAGMVEQMEE